nr:T9SS type A sorting domain-containing protein [Bacteroidota bacterium]
MENPKNLDFKIFPNPIKTHFWLEFPEPIQKAFDITIFDLMGNKKFENHYPLAIYKYFTVDITCIEPGAYILMLTTASDKIFKKIIVN